MRAVITVFELLILLIASWLVFPKLIFGIELTHILPGIPLTSSLTLKHLLYLSALILLYCTIVVNTGPGIIGSSLSRLSPFVKALILFTLSFGVYLHATPSHTGDNIPSKLLPISIVEERNLDLDEFRYAIYRGHYYCMTKKNDHFYSTYPIYPGITVTPFYAAVKLLLPEIFFLWKEEYSHRNGDLLNGFVQMMHSYSAAIMSALAVVIFWLIGNRLGVSNIISLPTTMAFAFGTPMMSSLAAALWTHNASILFVLLALFFSASSDQNKQSNASLFSGGLCAAWAVACRPTTLISVTLLTLFILLKYRRRAFYFLLSFLLVVTAVSFLNLHRYGEIFGAYQDQVSQFTVPTVERLYYLLMSPGRGLLVFVPCTFLLIFYIPRIFRKKVNLLTLCILAAAGELALYSCWSVWWGGNCFGPRLLADCIMWCLLAILAANINFKMGQGVMAKAGWLGMVFLVFYSVCLHTTGAIYGDKNWDRDYMKDRPEALMHWKNSPVMWTLTNIRNDPENKW
jgi:hypothetical protein